ncbi:MAG TPA: histidinol-phosphate transaminase [Selenomonadales bacterium]|nr:histidinol-phosphate transaminase [Selenomonadales bacterium]
MFRFREGLEILKGYRAEEGAWRIKLDANERAGRFPAAVEEALRARLAALALNRYPEMSQQRLKGKIAAGLGLKPENVVIGNGSSELLAALCHTFGGAGRKIVVPSPSFSMYPVYCQLADSQPVRVALEDDFTLAPDKVAAAAQDGPASLVLVCNPNNPTGGLTPAAAIEQILRDVDCPVAVDEAYGEFSGQSALDLMAKYPRLIVVRTFSKAYGLAGARVGYAVMAEEIARAVEKVLLPYHVNALSLAAAETVFDLAGEFGPGLAETVAERERLAAGLGGIRGVTVFPSATNFLLFRTAPAAELVQELAAKGIGIRDFSRTPGLAGCLRVTIGTSAENAAFLAAVRDFFQGRCPS